MKTCSSKNCYDEYIGMVAIGISVLYYIIQSLIKWINYSIQNRLAHSY